LSEKKNPIQPKVKSYLDRINKILGVVVQKNNHVNPVDPV